MCLNKTDIKDKEKFKETKYLFPFLHLNEIQTTEIEMKVGLFGCCFHYYHIFREHILKIIISHALNFVILISKKSSRLKFQSKPWRVQLFQYRCILGNSNYCNFSCEYFMSTTVIQTVRNKTLKIRPTEFHVDPKSQPTEKHKNMLNCCHVNNSPQVSETYMLQFRYLLKYLVN